ncbi:energy-coupling factor ABC transporter ATP-binding protein [Salinispirillum marinum]|uniref:Energy-coupling factor ABC transporter ATP-binding protein n=2 Tax=Saccharospirillaceae TaxID=255527 RepID=A0ABV8BE84_9GAMM
MPQVHCSDGIHFDHLRVERDGVVVIPNLSLQLTERRIGLIGHNGSGKSSLVRVVNGLLPSTTGHVEVFGENPSQGPRHMASTVGFIFQNPDHQVIFPTVIEELAFGLRNQGLSRRDAEQHGLDLLARYGRADWAYRPVHALSDGQKQLLCIFAVLLLEPKLLILDEPFSALDLPTRYQLLDLLHSLPQQILMISHELDTLNDFDRVIWLEQGQLKGDGTPQEILPEYVAHARAQRAEWAVVTA